MSTQLSGMPLQIPDSSCRQGFFASCNLQIYLQASLGNYSDLVGKLASFTENAGTI
jgi:hypothetical protein